MLSVRKIAILDALGVTAYSRTRKIAAQPKAVAQVNALAQANALALAQAKVLAKSAHAETYTAPRQPEIAPIIAPARAALKAVVTQRNASTRAELVMPSAELERFIDSRMYRHFCLLLAQGTAIPAVENSVLSDTALHFELPPNTPLKLGSMALLRSAWRAKRQAWLAIRMWRKQLAKHSVGETAKN